MYFKVLCVSIICVYIVIVFLALTPQPNSIPIIKCSKDGPLWHSSEGHSVTQPNKNMAWSNWRHTFRERPQVYTATLRWAIVSPPVRRGGQAPAGVRLARSLSQWDADLIRYAATTKCCTSLQCCNVLPAEFWLAVRSITAWTGMTEQLGSPDTLLWNWGEECWR